MQIEIWDAEDEKPLVVHQRHIYKLPSLEPKAASRFAGGARGGAASSGLKKLQEAEKLGLLHPQRLAASHLSGLVAVAKGRHVGILNLETLLTSNEGNITISS